MWKNNIVEKIKQKNKAIHHPQNEDISSAAPKTRNCRKSNFNKFSPPIPVLGIKIKHAKHPASNLFSLSSLSCVSHFLFFSLSLLFFLLYFCRYEFALYSRIGDATNRKFHNSLPNPYNAFREKKNIFLVSNCTVRDSSFFFYFSFFYILDPSLFRFLGFSKQSFVTCVAFFSRLNKKIRKNKNFFSVSFYLVVGKCTLETQSVELIRYTLSLLLPAHLCFWIEKECGYVAHRRILDVTIFEEFFGWKISLLSLLVLDRKGKKMKCNNSNENAKSSIDFFI